jgi:hypothetical protein
VPTFGRARLGRNRFGHSSALGRASVGAGATLDAGAVAASHQRLIFLSGGESWSATDTRALRVIRGSITESMQGLPYASGSVEVRNLSGENNSSFPAGSFVTLGEVRRYPFAGGAIRSASLGTFKVRACRPGGSKDARTLTLDLTSPATDLTGPKVGGDLTTQITSTAIGATVGLAGGPVRASVEGIIGWLIGQTSGGVSTAGTSGRTPAYTAWFTDEAGVDRTTGPFLIVPEAEATQILENALKITGGYITGAVDGSGSFGSWPQSIVAANPGATTADVPIGLTGTVSRVAGQTALTGIGTAFTDELAVGSTISATWVTPQSLVLGEYRIVTAIADDTHLTVDFAWNQTASDTNAYRIVKSISAAVLPGGGIYGDGAGYLPIVKIEQLTVDVPRAVVITNQTAVNAPRTVTVTVAGGTLKEEVMNFAAFSPPDGPVFRDTSDSQTAVANIYATRHARRHRPVNLDVLSNFSDRANGWVELANVERYGVLSGRYQIVSATHNMPGPTDSLTLWPGF